MDGCPDAVTWQSLVDGEITNPELRKHLDGCPGCRDLYREISGAAALADELALQVSLAPDFARKVLRRARPFPAGAVAVLIFALMAAAAAILDPAGLSWWFTTGITRLVAFLLDAGIGLMLLLRAAGPAAILAAAALLLALELLLLGNLKTVEG